MNKAAGVVVGVVVVAGVAWAGTAWYTGSQVESRLQSSIAKVNEQFKMLMPGSNAALTLTSFDRGVFSSTAHYSLKVPYGAAKEGGASPVTEFDMIDYIEHGPFPLTRLKSGQLVPVMATSHAQLEKNDAVSGWFAATKDKPPVATDVSLAYGGNVTGAVTLAPADYAENGNSLKFSGMTLDIDAATDSGQGKASGSMDSLVIAGKDETSGKPMEFEVHNAALTSDMTLSPSKLYVGKNNLTIKQVNINAGAEGQLVLNNYSQRIDLDENAGKYGGSVVYEIGMVNVAGKDVAGGQFAMSAKNLDPAAIKALSDTYSHLAMRAMRDGHAMDGSNFAPTPEETQQFRAGIETLLAGNPSITIDPLLVKTDKGEGRFTLALDLAKPAQADLPPEEAIQQTIRKLQSRLQISKPMVAGLLAQSMAQPGVDAAQALQQGAQQVDILSGIAVQSGMAKADGDNLIATLNYANGQVEFNGKKMPVAQFTQMIMGLVLGGSGLSGLAH
jgi:uncharacterized protein YdgA (DUF945 family)